MFKWLFQSPVRIGNMRVKNKKLQYFDEGNFNTCRYLSNGTLAAESSKTDNFSQIEFQFDDYEYDVRQSLDGQRLILVSHVKGENHIRLPGKVVGAILEEPLLIHLFEFMTVNKQLLNITELEKVIYEKPLTLSNQCSFLTLGIDSLGYINQDEINFTRYGKEFDLKKDLDGNLDLYADDKFICSKHYLEFSLVEEVLKYEKSLTEKPVDLKKEEVKKLYTYNQVRMRTRVSFKDPSLTSLTEKIVKPREYLLPLPDDLAKKCEYVEFGPWMVSDEETGKEIFEKFIKPEARRIKSEIIKSLNQILPDAIYQITLDNNKNTPLFYFSTSQPIFNQDLKRLEFRTVNSKNVYSQVYVDATNHEYVKISDKIEKEELIEQCFNFEVDSNLVQK